MGLEAWLTDQQGQHQRRTGENGLRRSRRRRLQSPPLSSSPHPMTLARQPLKLRSTLHCTSTSKMETLSSQEEEEEERRMNEEIFGGYNFICFALPVHVHWWYEFWVCG